MFKLKPRSDEDRLALLRLQLYSAYQTLKGKPLEDFYYLLREVLRFEKETKL